LNKAKIQINNVSKSFGAAAGNQVEALRNINLTVRENEFLCIIGRSGCGKSTLLNMIAGFTAPTSGTMFVDDEVISGPGKGKGVVFQNLALFPWLSARGNIEFGCKQQGVSKDRRAEIARDLIDLVHLTGFENKYPHELSGGMQQRVAIARALAIDPKILLMDEPFGALDEQTRMSMQSELLNIWASRKKTVIFITHSVSEAIVLADRIIVLHAKPGRVGAEFELNLSRPRDRLSMEFVELEAGVQNALG